MVFNASGGTKFKYPTCSSPHVVEHNKHLENMLFTKEFYLTSAQLLALHATPVTVLLAPGADLCSILKGVMIYKAAGTAYAGIASGEDLAFNYTDGSGLQLASCETTGFLDQSTAQTRFVKPYAAASGVSDITPVANAAIVIQLLSGEITTGNSPLQMRIQYSVCRFTLDVVSSSQTTG